ncbi:MAG: hypothetical protein HY242_03700 [Afipia sp.]|nr:hypothetical protein [Afipia sp.]
MSEQNSGDQIDKSGDHSEASLVPDSSKEIVLQRLTPNSSWDDPSLKGAAKDGATESPVANRRSLSLAAIVTIAAAVGAAGGSAATFGIGHFTVKNDGIAALAAADQNHASIEGAIAKVNSEIASLKAAAAAQSAKLTKLSETADKLRAPETTGSITPPQTATAAPNRLPIVDGWTLRDVGEGAARVVGRLGIFEVYPGDPLPGVGRVDAIRKQDGRWVVVTSRGLIVER